MCSAMLVGLTITSFSAALKLWVVATVICFAATHAWFLWARKKRPEWKLDAAMVFSIFWGMDAGISVLFSIFFNFDSERQQVHAFLCALVGAAAGWCVGMYLTPQDAVERGQFARVGAAAAVLASGYGIKSLQDAASQSVVQQHIWYLVVSGLCALLTAATIYNTRAYGTNFVKIWLNKTADKTGVVSISKQENIFLKARVSGQDDSSVHWYVLPSTAGSIADGVFTPVLTGECILKAESVGDPTLCDVVKVRVT